MIDVFILIIGIIMILLMGQLAGSGNIGNRAYSSWYETHFLMERKGICRLIYYTPKHFGRYTLYEVCSFFSSFIYCAIAVVVAFLAHVNVVTEIVLNVLFIVAIGLLFISSFVIVIINDIGSHKDDKKRFYLETGERKVYEIQDIPSFVDNLNNKLMSKVISLGIQQRNNTYFTIYNLRDSYYTKIEKAKNDITKIENINKEYINYFKNIEKLVVLKENKDGTLVFRK